MTCSCRRALTEEELIYANGMGGKKPVDHDEPNHLLEKRLEYALRNAKDALGKPLVRSAR